LEKLYPDLKCSAGTYEIPPAPPAEVVDLTTTAAATF